MNARCKQKFISLKQVGSAYNGWDLLLTVRHDHEVIDYFKRINKGYQKKMNAVLKAYVRVQRELDLNHIRH